METPPLPALVYWRIHPKRRALSNSTSNNAGSAKNPGFQILPYRTLAKSRDAVSFDSRLLHHAKALLEDPRKAGKDT
jgi:hypothetical protein